MIVKLFRLGESRSFQRVTGMGEHAQLQLLLGLKQLDIPGWNKLLFDVV